MRRGHSGSTDVDRSIKPPAEEHGHERQRGDQEVQRDQVTRPIVGIAGVSSPVPPLHTAARRTRTCESRKRRGGPLRRAGDRRRGGRGWSLRPVSGGGGSSPPPWGGLAPRGRP